MRHRSTALPLALAFVVLVLYASLYPFEGWRWPPGLTPAELVQLRWPPWRDTFDEVANVLGYVPLGLLLFVAVVRSGGSPRAAWAVALGGALLLSYAVEVTQTFLPQRVPSLRDVACNALGTVVGAGLGAALLAAGAVDRWHALREDWFGGTSGVALGLLLLWPAALLFPAPVPLGLGAVWGVLGDALGALLAGTPWAATAEAWLGQAQAVQAARGAPTPLREMAIVALGLLAPTLLAYAAARPGWPRIVLALGALGLALGTSMLSTALNFGPTHALTWWSAPIGVALGLATLIALALAWAPTRLAAALALLLLAALVVLVAQVPADPYYAASLQGWEQGRFIRFHGLAQWVGWLWPYAAMAWLLARVSSGEP